MTKKDQDRWARLVETVYRRMGARPEGARWAGNVLADLESIGRSLHRIYERQCSEEMSESTAARLEKREASLEKRAQAYAAELGAELYLQTDCRGGTVYLIFPGDIPEGQTVSSGYTNGVFVG